MRAALPITGLALAILLAPGQIGAAPASAPKPSIRILQPQDGATVAGSTVTVRVAVSNFKLVKPVLLAPAQWTKIPLLKGNQGHIHYVLDDLSNMVLTRDVVVRTTHTWTGVTPGPHTITAYLATSQHAPFPGARPAVVHITVRPSAGQGDARGTRVAPSISFAGYREVQSGGGTTLLVRVKVSNFKLVPPVYKNPPLLPGNQGHIHYVLDGLSSFVATRDAVTSLSHPWENVEPGEHVVMAYLANSQHQLFPGTKPVTLRVFIRPSTRPGGRTTLRIGKLAKTGGAAGGIEPLPALPSAALVGLALLSLLVLAALRRPSR